MTVETTYPRAMDDNIAAVEPDLTPGPTPAMANAAAVTAMARAGELLRVSHCICSMAPIPAVRQKRSN